MFFLSIFATKRILPMIIIRISYAFIFLFLCLCLGCQQPNPYQESNDFFAQERFKGNFFRTFNLLDADTVVKYIRDEAPLRWQGSACEGAYYNMTGKHEGVSDSIQLRLMDKFDVAFPDDSVHAFTQMIRGEIFIDRVQYDTARKCLQNAYDLSIKGNRLMRAADVTNVFALLAQRENDYPEATKLFLENYNYFSQLDTLEERGRMFNIYKSLIRVYRKSQNFKEAHKWCLNAWAFTNTGPKTRLPAYGDEAATMLAESYWQVHQLDSAQIMLDTAYYYKNLFNKNFDKASGYRIQAKIYLESNRCKDALVFFGLAKTHNKDLNRVVINEYDKELGDCYACLGRLDSAIYFYKSAILTPEATNQLAVLEALSKTYILRGDYAKAYDYEQQSKELRNRIFTNEKEQAIGRLQATSEVARRERLLAEQEKRTKLNRVLMLSALLVLSVGLIVGLFWIYRKKQELRLATQEKYLLEKEKKRIEAQARLKEQALAYAEQELISKDIALEETSKMLDLKNLLIKELEMKLTKDNQEANSLKEAQLYNLKILTSEDWRMFRTLFEQRFPSFFSNLQARFPKLTPAETRLLLLTKLKFETTEISNILGISATSVYTSRSRLRKRLGLTDDDDLEQFVEGL